MIIYTYTIEKRALQQPVLKGLREDKKAKDCIQSEPYVNNE